MRVDAVPWPNLAQSCPNVAELHLAWTLLESWEHVHGKLAYVIGACAALQAASGSNLAWPGVVETPQSLWRSLIFQCCPTENCSRRQSSYKCGLILTVANATCVDDCLKNQMACEGWQLRKIRSQVIMTNQAFLEGILLAATAFISGCEQTVQMSRRW